MNLKDLPLHHAILLVHHDRPSISRSIWDDLKEASPAHRIFDQTVLDIETARNIISWAGEPYNDERVAVISFHTATLPAQNAMLKILEEPRENVRFILITSNKSNLIDTVLSRTRIIEDRQQIADNRQQKNVKDFLSTPHEMRMKMPYVVELLSRTDEGGRKDREGVRNFILSLSGLLTHEKVDPRYIIKTMEVASYASDPSASGKALIEYLALLLPQTSR